jgi:hypothetical protein
MNRSVQVGLRFCVDKPLLDARCDELASRLLLIKVPVTAAGVTRYLAVPDSLLLPHEPSQATRPKPAHSAVEGAEGQSSAAAVSDGPGAELVQTSSGSLVSLARVMSAQIGLANGINRAVSSIGGGGDGWEELEPSISGLSDSDVPQRCATEVPTTRMYCHAACRTR